MKYRVTGAHRGTGARMSLEFEADSKAAAERKAAQAGMEVHRVADAAGGPVDAGLALGTGGRRTGMHPVVKLIVLIVALAALWFFVIPLFYGRR